MCHPTAEDRTAVFFHDSNLQGEKRVVPANGGVYHDFPKHVADEYKSLSLGLGSAGFFWDHMNTSDSKVLLAGDYKDLHAAIGNATCYSIDPFETQLIEFTFVDATGSKPGAWELVMQVHHVGVSHAPSGDGKYHIAGKISEQIGDVNTAVAVRNKATGVYPITGSIFFLWNKKTEQVDIDAGKGQWPKQLKIEKVDGNRFKVTLLSVPK